MMKVYRKTEYVGTDQRMDLFEKDVKTLYLAELTRD